jgi:hypothetical protein
VEPDPQCPIARGFELGRIFRPRSIAVGHSVATVSAVNYRLTEYTDRECADRGVDRQAVAIEWPEVEKTLGRKHNGTPEDDEALARALIRAGAPAWVDGAAGGMDELGLFLLGPAVTSESWEQDRGGYR